MLFSPERNVPGGSQTVLLLSGTPIIYCRRFIVTDFSPSVAAQLIIPLYFVHQWKGTAIHGVMVISPCLPFRELQGFSQKQRAMETYSETGI